MLNSRSTTSAGDFSVAFQLDLFASSCASKIFVHQKMFDALALQNLVSCDATMLRCYDAAA